MPRRPLCQRPLLMPVVLQEPPHPLLPRPHSKQPTGLLLLPIRLLPTRLPLAVATGSSRLHLNQHWQ
jgi:hypothetical protein